MNKKELIFYFLFLPGLKFSIHNKEDTNARFNLYKVIIIITKRLRSVRICVSTSTFWGDAFKIVVWIKLKNTQSLRFKGGAVAFCPAHNLQLQGLGWFFFYILLKVKRNLKILKVELEKTLLWSRNNKSCSSTPLSILYRSN